MKLISLSNELETLEVVGGKGHNLQKLINWGAEVPEFFVITTKAFESFASSGVIPKEVRTYLTKFLLTHRKIALRSSMVSEDQFEASFAGMFDTVLDVTDLNWEESLLKVYGSVNSPRVKEYLSQKNINSSLKMAVVAQLQIDVEKSGVLFTRSPVEPTSTIAIDAAFGMGEGVVSGHALVDHLQLSRSGQIFTTIIRNEKSVLSNHEINLLRQEAIKLETSLGKPCDIEWGYSGHKLHIFQIRPVTRLFEPLKYFVDTNLSESYPGSVSPFTAKFVQKVYENVFIESAIIFGAGENRLKKLKPHYAKIIGCVSNHLYYNLEHYYAILRALPGGEKNIQNWHKMIGGDFEMNEIPFHNTGLSPFETVKTYLSILKIIVTRGIRNRQFLDQLHSLQSEIERESANLKSSQDIIQYLNALINRPLGFGLTVVNDVFIMKGLGYLTNSLKNKGADQTSIIDLLKTSREIESLNPLKAMDKLVSMISDEFIRDFEQIPSSQGHSPYLNIFSRLRDKWPREVIAVESFLKEFGDRSFEELKLESFPMRNNPKLFIQLLKWSMNTPHTGQIGTQRSTNVSLNWLDERCLSFTKDCIAMREETRLWRGKYYNLLRQLILKLASQLKLESEKWNTFEIMDFFSITHTEWSEHADGKLSFEEIKKRINHRSSWKEKRHYPEFIEWCESEDLPVVKSLMTEVSGFKGQGVSPGIIEGTALVLESPDEALVSGLSDFILVTKNTDPAWVYIMSRSLGLISEKGSLLSHTAIIGRELGIPTLVGVPNATSKIKNGSRIRIDGSKGTIEVL